MNLKNDKNEWSANDHWFMDRSYSGHSSLWYLVYIAHARFTAKQQKFDQSGVGLWV